MPFQMIEGRYFVKNSSPDGDSIKFKASKPSRWGSVPGKKVKLKNGLVQLRVEAIDALETHFKSEPKAYQIKQPEPATARLLDLLGIENVKWGEKGGLVVRASDGVPGYILTRGTGPYGRPISFLFAGSPPSKASEQFLDIKLLKRSVNYKLLKEGLAYPLFYNTLFYDLRESLRDTTEKARKSRQGIWAVDKTLSGVNIRSERDVTGKSPILPKIFRRVVEHFRSGKMSLKGLDKRLGREEITILPQVQITGFDEVVNISGHRLKMTVPPESIIVGSVLQR